MFMVNELNKSPSFKEGDRRIVELVPPARRMAGGRTSLMKADVNIRRLMRTSAPTFLIKSLLNHATLRYAQGRL